MARTTIGVVALLLACGACRQEAPPPTTAPTPATVADDEELAQRRALERDAVGPVEDANEDFLRSMNALANAMRLGDLAAMATHFPPELEATPYPGPEAGAPHALGAEGFHDRVWTVSHDPTPMSRDAFLASFEAWIAPFADIEDVRWKIGSSSLVGDAGLKGVAKFKVIGRLRSGQRSWVSGKAYFSSTRDEAGDWTVTRFAWKGLHAMTADRDLFSDVTDAAGLAPPAIRHELPKRGLGFMARLFRGAAVADVNRDGRLDLYVGGRRDAALYLNSGDGTFREVADEAGLRTPIDARIATVPLLLDHDGDGDADLFVAGTGPFRLYENRFVPDGAVRFVDVTEGSGLDRSAWAYSATAGDIDRDGDVDLYVTSYNEWPMVLPDSWHAATNGTPNLLFVNQGDGTFVEAAEAWGVAGAEWSFAAQLGDVDGDGDPDLFVANDYGSGSRLYRNEGDRFVDVGQASGAWDVGAGMGVDFGDYDSDGDLDIHLTNMSSSAAARIFGRLSETELPDVAMFRELAAGNRLFRNKGDGTFEDVTQATGPFKAGWAWGGGFTDIDNDGHPDLHVPNGFLSGSSFHDT